MKKYVRYICGIMTAAALLAADISWPVAHAQEDTGQEILEQEGQASGEAQMPNEEGEEETEEGGQASEDDAAGEGTQSPEEGQAPEDDQAPDAEQTGNQAGEEDPPEDGQSRAAGGVDEETAEWIRLAGEELAGIAAERDIMALVYLSDEYPVRVSPSYESEAAITVLSGQTVNILDMAVDENMEVWH